MTLPKRHGRRRAIPTSWDPVARWYDGWVGADGSHYHRSLAVPAVLDLLYPQPDERILDVGAGQGVLAPYVTQAGASYVGIDASEQLLRLGRRRHGAYGTFLHGDARALWGVPGLQPDMFDAVVFMLSIQDMDPLPPVLASAAWALRCGGRVVILMTHPCFRIPRQSGWGWDPGRKLRYRRVDRYLSRLAVPMKDYGGKTQGATRSFHRPLHAYVNGLAEYDLLVDRMQELAAPETHGAKEVAEGEREFPLFLALRAIKGN